nr:DUF5615 family PIN-like protein [Flavobacterium cellulosilyticum]
MKLLLDENFSWRMIKKLSPFFEEVVPASELQLNPPADDIGIWNYAKKNGFTIVS